MGDGLTVLSLFNGISCGRVALEKSVIKVKSYISYEIDKYANLVAKSNYPKDAYFGDVVGADFSVHGRVDMLLGGSPCTSWSIAKRDREIVPCGVGWDLFREFVRAKRETNPRWFVYENNASISKDIRKAISKELGVEPLLINSALVSAQMRKRLYWTNIPGVAQPQDRGILFQDVLDSGVAYTTKAYCMTAAYMGAIFWNSIQRKQRSMVLEPIRLGKIGSGGQGQRIYSVEGKSVCLQASCGGGKTGWYKIDAPDGEYSVRTLSVLEGCRLQTLPDGYFLDESDKQIVSNTQAFKCIGNGWTVDVITHILSYLPSED